VPTAWQLLLGEVRAGHRRYAGTDRGDNYQRVLAHYGEGEYADPEPYERTLGDYVLPFRPVSVTTMCNVVTLESDANAEAWRLPRILSMVRTINQRGRSVDDLQ